MRAIVQDKYGAPDDVLMLSDIEQPAVGEDDVLVRVRAASVHADVWHVVTGWPHALRLMGAGLFRPKCRVPGTDLAGVVESLGRNVTRFQPGDEVFGESIHRHQWTNGGAFAEYATAPADALALKPDNVTFEQAAALPTAGLIALYNLRTVGDVQPGQKVLINGAGGGVGSIALQVAKSRGAEVTGVDGPTKLDMIRSLGADHVIDFTQEDFTRGSERYNLIFDVPCNHSFSDCRRALIPDGRYVAIGYNDYGKTGGRWLGSLPRFFRLIAMSFFVSQLPDSRTPIESRDIPLGVLKELLEAGRITPVVDRAFPLAEAADAIRYLAEGHAHGRIVIAI